MVLRALKKIFGRRVAEEVPSVVNGPAPAQPVASAITLALPPLEHQQEPAAAVLDDDAIIKRFEPLLLHGPRNTRILQTLAEAYARKSMFDPSLSFYRRVLEIAGGKNAAIEQAIVETTLKKFDLELSQLDPNAPDHAAQRERLQNQRLDYQWHEMEEPPRKDGHQSPVSGAWSSGERAPHRQTHSHSPHNASIHDGS
jgi:hypothetical protein